MLCDWIIVESNIVCINKALIEKKKFILTICELNYVDKYFNNMPYEIFGLLIKIKIKKQIKLFHLLLVASNTKI